MRSVNMTGGHIRYSKMETRHCGLGASSICIMLSLLWPVVSSATPMQSLLRTGLDPITATILAIDLGADSRLALISAFAAMALVAYLLVLVVLARGYAGWLRLRRSHHIDKWRVFLDSEMPSFPASVLKMRRRDTVHLMREWNLVYRDLEERSLSGEKVGAALERLRRIAEDVRISNAAGALLRGRSSRTERVAAAQCVGALGDSSAWDTLVGLCANGENLDALAAAEALVRIDADRAVPMLIAELCSRDMWPEHVIGHLIRLLSDQGRERMTLAILQSADPRCIARLFSGLEQINHAGSSTLLRHQIENAQNPDEVMEMLYASQDEGHIMEIERAFSDATKGRFPPWGSAPWMLNIAEKSRPNWRPLSPPSGVEE